MSRVQQREARTHTHTLTLTLTLIRFFSRFLIRNENKVEIWKTCDLKSRHSRWAHFSFAYYYMHWMYLGINNNEYYIHCSVWWCLLNIVYTVLHCNMIFATWQWNSLWIIENWIFCGGNSACLCELNAYCIVAMLPKSCYRVDLAESQSDRIGPQSIRTHIVNTKSRPHLNAQLLSYPICIQHMHWLHGNPYTCIYIHTERERECGLCLFNNSRSNFCFLFSSEMSIKCNLYDQ